MLQKIVDSFEPSFFLSKSDEAVNCQIVESFAGLLDKLLVSVIESISLSDSMEQSRNLAKTTTLMMVIAAMVRALPTPGQYYTTEEAR